MAKGGSKISPQAKEVKHQIKLLERRATNLINRGYKFTQEPVPERRKSESLTAYAKRLSGIKEKQLLGITQHRFEGEIMSGTKYRKREKTLSTKKGWQTRRAKADSEARKKYEEDMAKFQEGKKILDTIRGMIDKYASNGYYSQADYLSTLLNLEISTYGEQRVCRALAETSEDVIGLTRACLTYTVGDAKHTQAISTMRDVLTGGVVMSVDEQVKFNEMFEEGEDWYGE